MAHGGYSKGESGTYRLVRTLCKAVQERGCEKSGRMVQFKSFLENEKNITAVPLAPFKGNRFNILFLNGAGTFFLHKHCQEFFDRCKDENLLLIAVYHDLSVPQFIVGCHALGIIAKIVTGPLWRNINKAGHVLAMNELYQKIDICFNEWANDATPLIRGESMFDESEVVKDDIYQAFVLIKNDIWF